MRLMNNAPPSRPDAAPRDGAGQPRGGDRANRRLSRSTLVRALSPSNLASGSWPHRSICRSALDRRQPRARPIERNYQISGNSQLVSALPLKRGRAHETPKLGSLVILMARASILESGEQGMRKRRWNRWPWPLVVAAVSMLALMALAVAVTDAVAGHAVAAKPQVDWKAQ